MIRPFGQKPGEKWKDPHTADHERTDSFPAMKTTYFVGLHPWL